MAQAPTATELVATLFTGAALILGVLAIIIAVLAVWGYQAIKKEALDAAHVSAKAAILQELESAKVNEIIQGEVNRGVAARFEVLDKSRRTLEAFSGTDRREEGQVAKQYPPNEETGEKAASSNHPRATNESAG